MKAFLSLILCFILSLTLLSGCKEDNKNLITGEDNAKLIHFTDRFDEKVLLDFKNPFLDNSNEAEGTYLGTDELYKWSNLGKNSRVMPIFHDAVAKMQEHMKGSAEIIAKAKKNITIFDKWITLDKKKYLVSVENQKESIYLQDGKNTAIISEYSNPDGSSVFEGFSQKADTFERTLYIKDAKYEYSYKNGNKELYLFADNYRSYWNVMIVDYDGAQATTYNLLVTDCAYYVKENHFTNEKLEANGQEPLYIVSKDGNDIVRFNDTAKITVFLNGVGGYDYLAIGVKEEDKENPAVVTTESGKFVSASGLPVIYKNESAIAKKGDAFASGQMVCYDSKVGYDTRYVASLDFTVGGHTNLNILKSVKSFFIETGMSISADIDEIIKEAEIIDVVCDNIYAGLKWNNNSIADFDSIMLSIFKENEKFDAFLQELSKKKKLSSVNIGLYTNEIDNPSVSSITEVSGEAEIDENKVISMNGVSVLIDNLSLFDEEKEYKLSVALANEDYSYVIPLKAEEENCEKCTSTEEEFGISQDASYRFESNILPGKYVLVMYVSTVDGLRLSEFKEVPFNGDIPDILYEQTDIGIELSSGSALEISIPENNDIFVAISNKKDKYNANEVRAALYQQIINVGMPTSSEVYYYDTIEKNWEIASAELGRCLCRIPFVSKGNGGNKELYAYLDLTK